MASPSSSPAVAGRAAARRRRRFVGDVAMIAGALLLIDAALTLLWQEPLTGIYAALQRREFPAQLERHARSSACDLRALAGVPARPRLAALATQFAGRVRTGEAAGRVELPALEQTHTFVEGDDDASLQKGPGHFHDTPFPGQRGTVGIAGHRTTFGAPFRHIDQLQRGDRIVVSMPYGRFVSRVERQRAVFPTEVWVKRRVAYDRLILQASHPPYSARQRLIVFSRLVRSEAMSGERCS